MRGRLILAAAKLTKVRYNMDPFNPEVMALINVNSQIKQNQGAQQAAYVNQVQGQHKIKQAENQAFTEKNRPDVKKNANFANVKQQVDDQQNQRRK